MKIKAWLDSTANIKSKRVINLEYDDQEWAEMTEEEREAIVKEEVFQYLDWGFEEQ